MLWTAWLPANGERVTLNKLLKLKEGYKGRIQQKKEWERGVYIESHDDEFWIHVECLVERKKRLMYCTEYKEKEYICTTDRQMDKEIR